MSSWVPTRRRFLESAAALALLPFARSSLAGDTRRGALKIGIIGSGEQGGAIGVQWAKADHEILFSSRHPEELAPLVGATAALVETELRELSETGVIAWDGATVTIRSPGLLQERARGGLRYVPLGHVTVPRWLLVA